jgi:hypothetical protein
MNVRDCEMSGVGISGIYRVIIWVYKIVVMHLCLWN